MTRLSWGASLGVALLMLPVGLVASGFLAERWSRWYSWSTFEGAAGYAVILWALIGGIVSFVAGFIVARSVGPDAASPFLRALGISAGLVLGSVGLLAVAGRALADRPPMLGGERLMLLTDLRWPAAQRDRPAPPEGTALVRLGRRSTGRLTDYSEGLLWVEDARLEEGRWVAPGAVTIDSERGNRALDVVLEHRGDGETTHGFRIPLRGSPTAADTAWSAWMADAPGGFEVRYRVQPRSAVVRSERAGPFTVDAVIRDFSLRSYASERPVRTADAQFRIRLGDTPISVSWPDQYAPNGSTREMGQIEAVAEIPGPRPALLVAGSTMLAVVALENGEPRTSFVGLGGPYQLFAHPVTDDSALFHGARRRALMGRVDRDLLAAPGQYLVGDAVLDTRTLGARKLPDSDPVAIPYESVPVAVSPDGRSVVRFGTTQFAALPEGSEDTSTDEGRSPSDRPVLHVVDLASAKSYWVTIDRARMRYPDPAQLDPSWVAHHFEWVPGDGGAHRLQARASFTPLAHRGRLTEEQTGGWFFTLAPAREELREAIVDLLVREMEGERVEVAEGAYLYPVRIGTGAVDVAYDEGRDAVTISLQTGSTDSTLVRRVAAHVDSVLATGRLDAHFRR